MNLLLFFSNLDKLNLLLFYLDEKKCLQIIERKHKKTERIFFLEDIDVRKKILIIKIKFTLLLFSIMIFYDAKKYINVIQK